MSGSTSANPGVRRKKPIPRGRTVREREQAALIGALHTLQDRNADDLAERFRRCLVARIRERVWRDENRVVGDTSTYYRCKRPGCQWCRTRIARNGVAIADRRLGTLDNPHASFVTILLVLTTDLTRIRGIVQKTRKQLRYLRDAASKRQAAWGGVRASGHVEIGAVARDQIGDLRPQLRKAVQALPKDGCDPDADPIWFVHLHWVVRHEGISRLQLRKVLARRYDGPYQVDVRPLHQDKTEAENVDTLISYSLKHPHTIKLKDRREEKWPLAWQARYYAWLHSIGRSMQPLRVELGSKKVAASTPPVGVSREAGGRSQSRPPVREGKQVRQGNGISKFPAPY